jgi:hypothetical protein
MLAGAQTANRAPVGKVVLESTKNKKMLASLGAAGMLSSGEFAGAPGICRTPGSCRDSEHELADFK